MRSFVPACSISTSAIPSSATFSISSTISLKFIAKDLLGAGKLESCAAVIAVRRRYQEHVILRSDFGDKHNVLLGHERKLMHLSGIQLRVRQADRLDESAELRAHHIDRNTPGIGT